MVALGVVAGKERHVGRGSPRRGSRKRDTEKETRKKEAEINGAHKNPQHKIPLQKSIQYIYETPEILRSIFSTGSCLQSDNGVSTSNSRVGNQLNNGLDSIIDYFECFWLD